MILGGAAARDVSPGRSAESAAMSITQRCERPHDHRPHGPYVRSGSKADYSCPGGPLDPTLFATDDQEAAS